MVTGRRKGKADTQHPAGGPREGWGSTVLHGPPPQTKERYKERERDRREMGLARSKHPDQHCQIIIVSNGCITPPLVKVGIGVREKA